MNLPSISIRHPQVVLVSVIVSTVWGLVAFFTLPRQEEPELTWRLANVVTRLPGAAPPRVESLITDVLERHIEQVDEVEHIYSVSRSGVSLIQVELSDEVTVAAPVWQKVRHKLIEAASELPSGTLGPELDDEIMGTFAALVAITSPTRGYRELKDQAQRLEDQLRFLPTTASTSLFGVQREIVEVEPQPARLAAFDLSFHQLATALQRRNTRRPSGRVRVEESELLVEASGEFENESELRDMVLMVTAEGRSVRLGDVATIRRTTISPPEPLARVNGQRAVVLGVRARPDIRMDRYGDTLHRIIDRYRASLPEDYDCLIVHDLAKYTRHRAVELGRTLLLSITFVFLSTVAFMGWRAAGIVTASIPLTGLIVLILFSMLGIPLNQMSVMAVIMSLGLLVDDAIVVTEQIHRENTGAEDVSSVATRETTALLMPMVVSTLTTIGAFLPIYLLPGGTGEFVRAIPVSVTICLLTALFVAIMVIPTFCVRYLPRSEVATAPRRRFPSLSDPVMRVYRKVLDATVRRPGMAVLGVVFVLLLAAALGLTLRRDLFSPVQRDQFVIDVYGPQGSAVTHTAERVADIESLLARQANIDGFSAFVGRNAPLIFYNLASQETHANHFAQIIVTVDDSRDTTAVAQQVQTRLRSDISGCDCVVHIMEHGAPYVAPYEVRIGGPSIPQLQELGRRVVRVLNNTSGVRNVRTNYGNESLKLVAAVNEPVARYANIDQQTVADELRYRLDGLIASNIQEGDERIDISVRLPEHSRQDIAGLQSVYFKPIADDRLIPFSAVAKLEPTWEASSIYRRDGERTLSVLAYPQFGLTAVQVSKRFVPKLESLASVLPDGYRMEVGGENEQRHEAESNLIGKAVYAVGLIVFLLIIEFRSFRLVGLILAVIPLSLSGTMLALWITGWPLNFMAIMGMMMLIGVVVNDALILVDGYERRRRQGQSLRDRVIDGTLARTRHVVITTVTTVAGFMPLAVSPSLLWPPLALAIIGGLALSTLLTLVALPAAYLLLSRDPSVAHSN